MARAPWLALVLTASVLSACAREQVPRYSTRGQVTAVEGTGSELRVVIHHERIAAFKDREGKLAAMPSMKMAFALGPGVDAAALTAGRKLAFEFEVHWTSSPTLIITRVTLLPENAQLALTYEH